MARLFQPEIDQLKPQASRVATIKVKCGGKKLEPWMRLPTIRGAYHIYKLFRLMYRGRPARSVQMRLGHRMIVDPTSPTEMTAFYEGRYDDEEIGLLRSLMRPGEVTLDIGGNVGFYAIPLAITAKTVGGKVISFEPVPANYERMRENARINMVGAALIIEPFGLSSASAEALITLREHQGRLAGSGNAAVFIPGHDDAYPVLTIPLQRLDDLPLERVGLIKLDIEGHEDEFLKGAHETLMRERPIIFLEVNRNFYARKDVDFDDAFRHLIPENFSIFRISFRRHFGIGERLIYGLRKANDISECDAENILVVPIEKLDRISPMVLQ